MKCADKISVIEQGHAERSFGQIIGNSPALESVLANVERVAPTDSMVLILGETGTGKELIACAIHQSSSRLGRPFIMNSRAARLTETWTEIARLFARLALGASFLSAVADRFGLWGPYGAKNVSWGNFAHFVEYTGAVTSLFPSSLTVSFAWAATFAETFFGILLIAGFKIRMTSVLSGLLLLLFAMGMITGLGIKTPFDYSVCSAAAAAFLLAFWEPDRFTLDKLLNRSRN